MRILITGARAPVALELVRALGSAGHTVYAADSFSPHLAGSSRYAAAALQFPAPRYDAHGFQVALRMAVARYRIDLIIPTCEEIFYVAMDHAALSAQTALLSEPLELLVDWHHKGRFQQRAAALGLKTPRTLVISTQAELVAQLPAFPRYILKPAYSRFATRVITNCGPYAGRRSLAWCQPTPAQPWLLQEFIEGEAVCSYTILHGGRITAHTAYTTPQTAGLGAGIAFVTVDGSASLAVAATLGSSGYHGQLALDFVRTATGDYYLLECNPRSTSGIHLIQRGRLVRALLDRQAPTWVEPPGRRAQISALALPAVGAALLRRPASSERWAALITALRTPDVIMAAADPRPALTQLLQTLRFAMISRRRRIGLIAATTDEIEWNG